MKKRVALVLISAGIIFASAFGATNASWSVSDNAGKFGVNVEIEPPAPITTKVYFQSSFYFGSEKTVYAYAWDSADTSKYNAAWPGVAMTAENYKHGLYSYDVSTEFNTIIFHGNGGNSDPTKTGDLTIDRTNVYYCQHQNAWNDELSDCTFSYYMTGKFNGTEAWGTKVYEKGLLKNYAGNNVSEYMNADYSFKTNDEFKIISEDGSTWYGVNGSSTEGAANYKVLMANSGSATANVYFKPNEKLYAGAKFHFFNESNAWGDNLWCHQWKDTSETTTWPGDKMTKETEDYWYYVYVSLRYTNVIFNNEGSGGLGNHKTADLLNIDAATPYYDGSSWKASA